MRSFEVGPVDADDVEMLAGNVERCRDQLRRALPHERVQRAIALRRALQHLADYLAVPDPDHEKERRAVNAAAEKQRLAAADADVLAARSGKVHPWRTG